MLSNYQTSMYQSVQNYFNPAKETSKPKKLKLITLSKPQKYPIYIQKAINNNFIKSSITDDMSFIVIGVKHARIELSKETGLITHKYAHLIKDSTQYELFKTVFNNLNAEFKKARNQHESRN